MVAPCSVPVPPEARHVGKIDPVAMKVQELLKESYVEGFVATTIAIQVDREIWIGTNRGDRIEYFPTP
jgi:hypothetical protein